MTEAKKKKAVTAAAESAAYELKSLRAPFTVEGNRVKIRGLILLQHVGTVTLLDSTVRQSLSAAENAVFDDVMVELKLAERKLVRVENLRDYLDGKKQWAKIQALEPAKLVQAVKDLGLEVSEVEATALEAYAAIRARILEFFGSLTPKYQTVGRPESTNHRNKLSVAGDRVSNGTYHLTKRQAKNIWERCFKVWGENLSDDSRGVIRYQYSTERVRIHHNSVQIGCQTIHRWQVEQLALEMRWLET